METRGVESRGVEREGGRELIQLSLSGDLSLSLLCRLSVYRHGGVPRQCDANARHGCELSRLPNARAHRDSASDDHKENHHSTRLHHGPKKRATRKKASLTSKRRLSCSISSGAQGGGSGGSLSSSGNRSFGAAPPFRAESSFGGRPRRFLATGGRSSISASREPSSARYVLGVRLRSWRLAPRASPSSSTPSTVLSAAGRLPIAKAEASPGDGGLGCPLGVDGGLKRKI